MASGRKNQDANPSSMASSDESVDERVCLGAVASPHGVRGLVRVKAFTDQPEDIASYGAVFLEDGRRFDLTVKGMVKGMVMTSFAGITSRDQAEALKGERFYVSRQVLPQTDDDEIYHADLIGAMVHDPQQGDMGRVLGVFDFGAGEMLEIKPFKGKPVMVPFHADAQFDGGDTITMSVDPIWFETSTKPDEASP